MAVSSPAHPNRAKGQLATDHGGDNYHCKSQLTSRARPGSRQMILNPLSVLLLHDVASAGQLFFPLISYPEFDSTILNPRTLPLVGTILESKDFTPALLIPPPLCAREGGILPFSLLLKAHAPCAPSTQVGFSADWKMRVTSSLTTGRGTQRYRSARVRAPTCSCALSRIYHGSKPG